MLDLHVLNTKSVPWNISVKELASLVAVGMHHYVLEAKFVMEPNVFTPNVLKMVELVQIIQSANLLI
jgi:hypothetical protein